jgi:hypothetical protein
MQEIIFAYDSVCGKYFFADDSALRKFFIEGSVCAKQFLMMTQSSLQKQDGEYQPKDFKKFIFWFSLHCPKL